MIATMALALAAAGQTAPAAPVTQAPTLQQRFDAATAAYDGAQWAKAAEDFHALEARLATAKPRTRGVVLLREGVALWHLERWGEAAALLREGLARTAADDATLRMDRYLGWMALGGSCTNAFDYPGALDAYAQAAGQAPDEAARASAIVAGARLQAVIDPKAALAAADRAATLLANDPSGRDAKTRGTLAALRGRVLLNDGQYAAAKKALEDSVSAYGGLTTKVRASDIAVRSDLAIASLLAGDSAAAKRYLAYAASGNLEDGFARGADMTPPACTGEPGLRPQDVTVVEFGIGEDGTVRYAMPVYASSPGVAVAAFARAVSGWSWSADRLAKIPLLFRYMTRLELRCSTADEHPGSASIFDRAVRRWMADRGLAEAPVSGMQAADLAAERAELKRRSEKDGAASPALAPVLFGLARNAVAPGDERQAAAQRLRDIVLAQNPPVMVAVAVRIAPLLDTPASGRHFRMADAVAEVLPILTEPAVMADAETLNALRLRIADTYAGTRNAKTAVPLVDAVIADPRLPQGDPVRIAALLRSSAIHVADGDVAGARAAYEKTGLTDAECALVDATPTMVKRTAGAADYPEDAIKWGISGWAVTEFDINAQGRTENVRAIVAYPPFVFDKPTERIFARTTYTQTYRPNGGLGCGGYRSSQGFRVLMP